MTTISRWVCILIVLVLGVTVILGLVFGLIKNKGTTNKGTTRNLKEIVVERCLMFIKEVDTSGNKCDQIWSTFKHAFIGKNPCNVKTGDYDQFIDTVRQYISRNKTLFWSKTQKIAHDFTKATKCFMTLEDTLVGYMMDGLTWCGQNSSMKFDYTYCPGYKECENNPVSSFWKRASKNFAESAQGRVAVMLNGSMSQPFSTSSIFGSIEVNNFNSSTISHVNIISVISSTYSGPCNSTSIRNLTSILKNNRINSTCKDITVSEIQNCTSKQNPQSCDCVINGEL
ncbi:ADP-ribosyl cyclase/cyclic ADP-ribose hydrolase 1-like isoform X1 [Acipenser ruthenus]|uniref:ADP-ribosyl cyclase/cyclic ADP-ribose hydrolase 1-like isoform X1 n=1 Tax=Acipenser ruthenus TaxID=7906 RepID=UPI00145B8DC4|nr:ADP-ribosyl cyclase/cyclic ADP-ribose hydrolase 1-like isoform X1 [Acipenser ruthenus]